jgi:hypothetical protein
MPQSSDEVIRQARERRQQQVAECGMPQSIDEAMRLGRELHQQQVAECARRAAKKIRAKLKGGRPSEATLTELIAGEFEELTR